MATGPVCICGMLSGQPLSPLQAICFKGTLAMAVDVYNSVCPVDRLRRELMWLTSRSEKAADDLVRKALHIAECLKIVTGYGSPSMEHDVSIPAFQAAIERIDWLSVPEAVLAYETSYFTLLSIETSVLTSAVYAIDVLSKDPSFDSEDLIFIQDTHQPTGETTCDRVLIRLLRQALLMCTTDPRDRFLSDIAGNIKYLTRVEISEVPHDKRKYGRFVAKTPKGLLYYGAPTFV